MFRRLALLLALPLLGLAQEPAFVVPLLGHVFDANANALRPMLGTPGAARVAAPVAIEVPLSNAAVRGSSGLALVPDLGLYSLGMGQEITSLKISDAIPSFEVASVSLSGGTAVAYSKECQCLQVVTGLPGEPSVARTIPFQTEGAVQALSVSNDGQLVAVSVWNPEVEGQTATGTVSLFRGDQVQILSETRSPGVSFGAQHLTWIEPSRATAVVYQLETGEQSDVAADGEGEPALAAFLTDTRLVLGTRMGSLTVVDLASGERKSAQCACRPEMAERLLARGLYRLTGMKTGAVWVLVAEEAEIRTFFIPVDNEPAGDQL
jgi:hypothetical protein